MKKYLSWIGLLPIALVTMVFLTEKEMNRHAEKMCFGLLISLIIFGLLYFMLLHLQVNRWLAIGIAFSLWIVMFFLKKQLYNY